MPGCTQTESLGGASRSFKPSSRSPVQSIGTTITAPFRAVFGFLTNTLSGISKLTRTIISVGNFITAPFRAVSSMWNGLIENMRSIPFGWGEGVADNLETFGNTVKTIIIIVVIVMLFPVIVSLLSMISSFIKAVKLAGKLARKTVKVTGSAVKKTGQVTVGAVKAVTHKTAPSKTQWEERRTPNPSTDSKTNIKAVEF